MTDPQYQAMTQFLRDLGNDPDTDGEAQSS